MEFKDYYAALEVDPSADLKTIKTAYRRLARKYHPDVSAEPNAENKFKKIAQAYEVLKSSERRAEYDELRQHRDDPRFTETQSGFHATDHDWRDTAGNSQDFSDFFESIFGRHAGGEQRTSSHQPYAVRGQDLQMEVALFLEETLNGQTRAITYQVPVFDASGRQTGAVGKTLNVKIPPGVGDGERIRLKGQGAAGFNGGPYGDLFLIIRIAPHPLYDIDGRDLHIVVPLSPWEAALGANIQVPTPTGKISLTVPAGSQSGKRLRIKGKGLTSNKETGDLYAILKVVMPPQGDEKTQQLWRQLAERAAFNPRAEWESSK